MMTNVPTDIIIARFKDEESADEALKVLEDANKQGLFEVDDAAVIKKDTSGKLHIKETTDPRTGRGAAIGGIIGGVVGLLGGPVGVVVVGAAGAAVGGLAASYDTGIQDEKLEQIGGSLEPDTSALLVVVDQPYLADVQAQLQERGADITTTTLSEETAIKFHAGEAVTFTEFGAEDEAAADEDVAAEGE